MGISRLSYFPGGLTRQKRGVGRDQGFQHIVGGLYDETDKKKAEI